jgi:hypothetical protein
MHFITTLPSSSSSSKRSPSFKISNQSFLRISHLPHACYTRLRRIQWDNIKKILVKQLMFMRITECFWQEVTIPCSGPNVGPQSGCPQRFLWFSQVTPGKWLDNTLKQSITISFHIHSVSTVSPLLLLLIFLLVNILGRHQFYTSWKLSNIYIYIYTHRFAMVWKASNYLTRFLTYDSQLHLNLRKRASSE